MLLAFALSSLAIRVTDKNPVCSLLNGPILIIFVIVIGPNSSHQISESTLDLKVQLCVGNSNECFPMIADDVDLTELVVFLPALCCKIWVPYFNH